MMWIQRFIRREAGPRGGAPAADALASPPSSPAGRIEVGSGVIETPPGHPLIEIYRGTPTYNRFLSRLARAIAVDHPGFLAIDIGANVGDTVLFLLDGAGGVVAVEGDEGVLSWLDRNLRSRPECRIHRGFLGEAPAPVRVSLSGAGQNAMLRSDAGEASREVHLTTLDGLAAGLGPDAGRVRLIKIDVEGFELAILRGARQCLAAGLPPLVVELNPDTSGPSVAASEIPSLLENLGYRHVSLFDNRGGFLAAGPAGDAALRDLLAYLVNPGRSILYYDAVWFAEADAALHERWSREERACIVRPLP
jgi:FkbM family methyltransferase